MKETAAKIVLGALLVLPLALATPVSALTSWDVSGDYVMSLNYLGTDYAHDVSLTQDGSDNLTGNGGSPAGANIYTWAVTSGTVSGNTVDFLANYTATADAVTPQTTMHVVGTVGPDGSISGVWTDNYQGGERAGTWVTTSGEAKAKIVTPPPTPGPSDKEACKKGGWKSFTNPSFKNQGQCVSSAVSQR